MKSIWLGLLSTLILVLAFSSPAADSKQDSPKNTVDTAPKPDSIVWSAYDDGVVRAALEKKHMFINFTAKWCGYCKRMNRTTFADSTVISMINDQFVAIKVDGDSNNELELDGYKITERNLSRSEFGVRGYPTYWFLKPDGTRLGALRGYQQTDALVQVLTFVAEEQYDTTKTPPPPRTDKSGR